MIDYYKNIPDDLKKEKRWCLYRIVNRNGKNTKIPIEPSGKYAKVSDKATWNTYERCLNSLDKADGLGFFLGDGYVGIDLDDVADDVYAYFTDNKESVTSDFLKNIDTYAEVSPSGRGIHFIGKGKLEGTRRRSGNIEIYDKDRFFTVTGKILNDKYRKKIANIETEINQLKAKYLPEFEKSEIDKSEVGDYKDREVLELFLNTDIGDTSEVKNEIFNGKWEKKFSSQSEADFYLARNLLFFNAGNIEQAYRLMNQSKLAREKWDEQRGSTDYLEYVLVRAKDGLTSYFQRGEKEEITTVNRKYTIDEVKQLINETINSFSDIENFNNYLKVSASNNNTFYTDRLMLLRFRKDSEETKSFEGWIETGRVVNKGEEGIPVLRNGQVKYIYDKSQTVVVNAELEKEVEKSNKTIVEKLKELNTFVNTESIEKTIENLGISYARRVYSRVRDNAPKTFESLDENVLGDFIKNTFTTIVKLKSGINAPDIKDEKGVLKVFLKNENDLKELLYSFWGCENALFNNLENRIEEIQRKMINDIDIDSTNGYNINRDINKEGSEENVSQSEVRSEEQRILNRRNDLLSGGKDERDGRDRLLAGRDGAGKYGIGDVGSGDRQGLEDKGIFNFDAWASNFADITVGYELEATGTKFRKRTRFSKFNNLPELMNIVKSFADIRTSDMLNLPVPEVEFKLETIEPSEIQKDYIKSLGDRADKIKSGSVDPSVDNMLVVTNDGKNLALDQRLVDPLLPDDPNSKVNACVGNVFRIYKDTEDKKLTQLIFCDTATPGGSSNICVYDDIKEKLIKMGAKESEIAFVHDAKNDKAKAELFSKVNKGEIRVLIGSTSKMGTGTNVQKKLIATHDLDVPWRPSDLEQRAGRIIRQGNENKKVEIYRYVTKGTLDSFLWQTLENKQRYISQVMTSRTPERSMEDCDEVTLDYATIKGIANGNPLIEEKFRLETEVAKLKTYEAAYRNNLYQYEDNLKIQYPKKEAIIKKKISDLTADIERRIDCNNEDKKFIGMQFENSFTDKKDIASEALMKNISKIEHSIKADPVKLCEYRGFEIYGKYEPLIGGEFKSCHQFIVKGSGSYIGELSDSGYGNIVRIDNVINNLTSKLEEAKSALIDLNNQKNNALEEINKPFIYKKELEEKVNRLNEVNKEIEIKTEGEPQQDSEKEEKNKSLVNDMETFREKAKAYNLERVSPGTKEKANEL